MFYGILQFHAQQGPVASGGDGSGIGGSISFSIGQIDYRNNAGSGGAISQGLQQPYEIFVVSGIEEKGIELTMSVYPNPTADFVFLNIENFWGQSMTFGLYDLQGKLIEKQKINRSQTSIPMVELANAIYFIKVFNNSNELKTFKIIKN